MVAQFGPVIRVIYRLLPDLSRLDWRDWTLYNLAPDGAGLTWSLLMAGGYILLLLAIAVLAFQRREFA
jgi:ABC-type transport system involved in multi-copper enzyme maturation permease subunit